MEIGFQIVMTRFLHIHMSIGKRRQLWSHLPEVRISITESGAPGSLKETSIIIHYLNWQAARGLGHLPEVVANLRSEFLTSQGLAPLISRPIQNLSGRQPLAF